MYIPLPLRPARCRLPVWLRHKERKLAHASLQTDVDDRFAMHVTHLEVCESVDENGLVSGWVDCFTDVSKLPSCTVREKCDGAHLLNLQ